MPKETRKQILVVEDEGLIAEDIKRRLERFGYTVPAIASSGEEALQCARYGAFDLALMDIHIKGEMDGIATAQAFVATFFGISLANLLWLPLASKVKERNAQLLLLREIMIEGIISIQAGDNPRLLEEKLHAFLDPSDRETEVEEGGVVGEPTAAAT